MGHVAIERDCLSLAAQCFSKASLYDHTNVTLLWQSASLYKEAGEVKRAIDKYEGLLRVRVKYIIAIFSPPLTFALPFFSKALPRDGSHDFFEATKELAKVPYSSPPTVTILVPTAVPQSQY